MSAEKVETFAEVIAEMETITHLLGFRECGTQVLRR